MTRKHDKRKEIVKLYSIPRQSKIYGFQDADGNDLVIIFDHPDGMYSYCWVEGDTSKLVHLSVATPLHKYRDGYKYAGETEQ